MIRFNLLLCIIINFATLYAQDQSVNDPESSLKIVRRSIFKIRTISAKPDFLNPWNHYAAERSFGSGFYIGNNMIMTNAHVVAQSRFLSVQRDGDSEPVPARILFIGHDCDLAVLTVDKPGYFDSVDIIKMGGVPRIQTPVKAYGYPMGGDQLSITEGVVSRFSYSNYSHPGWDSHLQIQVDSAINPGNSGGPVLQGNELVGVAFQGFAQAQNTGYIIPIPIVNRFLVDIKDGTYDGHPRLFIVTQSWAMLNPAALRYYNLPSSGIGQRVTEVVESGSAYPLLKKGDIILSIDNKAIGADGKVIYEQERVNYKALFDLKQIGEKVKFSVWRKGKKIDLEIPATKGNSPYNFSSNYNRHPPYFTYGGLVFSLLSTDLLRLYSKSKRSPPLLIRYVHSYFPFTELADHAEEAVVLLKQLPHEVNTDVSTPSMSIVESVNDVKIKDLKHMQQVLTDAKGEFIEIEYFNSATPTLLIREDAIKARKEILKSYGVYPEAWFED